MSKPAVLIIEDSASLALGYAAQLEEAGYEVTLAATLAEAEDALATTRFAATLLDLQLPDGDGLSLLEKRNATSPAFVVITADGSLSRAIAAMRLGAFDFWSSQWRAPACWPLSEAPPIRRIRRPHRPRSYLRRRNRGDFTVLSASLPACRAFSARSNR